MDYLKTGILIIGPYIIYYFLIKWLEDKYDFEMTKFIKTLIFISIDILIIMLFQ